MSNRRDAHSFSRCIVISANTKRVRMVVEEGEGVGAKSFERNGGHSVPAGGSSESIL